MKTLSIVGLVWFVISLLCVCAFNNSYDYEAAVGWGILGLLYAIALAIVTLVKSVGHNK